jgi:hypothetical protein
VNQYVVTVTGPTTAPDVHGPFPSRDAAWAFANKVRRDRRRDAAMPTVHVHPVKPARLTAVTL